MAYNKIIFENPNTGAIKEAPVGFSWTMFFFGLFVPMIRGTWKWVIIIYFITCFTLGLSSLIFPFIFNKIYIKELISRGFKAKSIETGNFDEVSVKIGIDLDLSRFKEDNKNHLTIDHK